MDDGDNAKRTALETFHSWNWIKGDPDGNIWTDQMKLGEAINRYAMQGLPKPQSTVLSLLCAGDLIGFGAYRWRKYQWGQFYSHENFNAQIDRRQWQVLSDLIADEARGFEGDDWPSFEVNLEKLQIPDCRVYSWDFSECRFSTARCPPEIPVHDKSYFEEWFSAWDIEIVPKENQEIDDDHDVSPVNTAHVIPALNAPANKGGRPLAEWWPDFVAELVAYIVEIGIPPGVGHQGQSEIIREVSERMQARDKGEPSRSQVQDAVNAVLRRMRIAGN